MKDDKLSIAATSQSDLPSPATGGIGALSCMGNWRFGLALKATSKERPAAVVLDLIMPEMNGFEFLKRLRKTSRSHRTPVIIWTSKDLTEMERVELHSSTSAVTKKADQADELIHEIRNILRTPVGFAQHTDKR